MLTLVKRPSDPIDRCPLHLPGMRALPLVTSDDSSDSMSILEVRVEPAASSPIQILRRQRIAVYVASGCLEFQIGAELRRVGSGGFLTIPTDVRHGFKNVGVTTGVLLLTVTPGGYEEYLLAFAKIAQDEFIDIGQMRKLSDSFGVEILSP